MRNINEIWLKKEINNNYKIDKLKEIKEEIINVSEAYKNVFNGEPFYEDWTLESSIEVITKYIKEKSLILSFKYYNEIIGFLVVRNNIPIDQQKYSMYLNNIKFIEEIGVLSNYRNNKIASELIRILLLKYLLKSDKYICYRTNAMRYFEYKNESFESALIRVQNEDKIKRLNGEKIIVPNLSLNEKQIFINKYIEVIKNNPKLDVSNSNLLFRDIFGNIGYSKINGNYTFQKDPTGDNNDRIFPIIDLKILRR